MKRMIIALAAALIAPMSSPALAHGPHNPGYSREQTDSGFGSTARDVTRTIELTLGDDMRFSREHIAVKLGETIRFKVKNTGATLHEMVIGTDAELKRQAMLMETLPHMTHDQPHMTHIEPKKTGEILWTFNRPGEFAFACLISGHYAAGMKGKITVAALPTDWIDATVKNVNPKTRKITLEHSAVASLELPATRTTFELSAGARGVTIAEGDKVRFLPEKVGNRRVVLAIETAK